MGVEGVAGNAGGRSAKTLVALGLKSALDVADASTSTADERERERETSARRWGEEKASRSSPVVGVLVNGSAVVLIDVEIVQILALDVASAVVALSSRVRIERVGVGSAGLADLATVLGIVVGVDDSAGTGGSEGIGLLALGVGALAGLADSSAERE